RPGDVLPAPLPERRVHTSDYVENTVVHIQHRAPGGVVGHVLAVPKDFDDLTPAPILDGLVEHPHEVGLGRLNVGLPPLIDDRIDVVVEQEDEFTIVEQLQALVLRPGDPDVLLESVGSFLDGLTTGIVNNDDFRTRRPAANLSVGLFEGLRSISGGDPDTNLRCTGVLRDESHAINDDFHLSTPVKRRERPRSPEAPPLPSELSARALRREGHERVQVPNNPAEGDLNQKRDLVGLPHRNAVDRGLVGHLHADLVGEAVTELAPVTPNDADTGVGGGTQVATHGTAELRREAEQRALLRSQVHSRRVGRVAARVGGHHRASDASPVTRVNSPAVELVGSSNGLVAVEQAVNQVLAKLDVVGVRQHVAAVNTLKSLTGVRTQTVEHRQVDTATDSEGEVGLDLVVQTVDVHPSELLGNGHDRGQLDRAQALRAPGDTAGRLLVALTVSVGGTNTHLANLRTDGVDRDHGLTVGHRDALTHTQNQRGLLRLVEDRADDVLGKQVVQLGVGEPTLVTSLGV